MGYAKKTIATDEKHALTVGEVSALTDLSPTTIYEQIAAKNLEAVRIGRVWRVTPQALARFLGEPS